MLENWKTNRSVKYLLFASLKVSSVARYRLSKTRRRTVYHHIHRINRESSSTLFLRPPGCSSQRLNRGWFLGSIQRGCRRNNSRVLGRTIHGPESRSQGFPSLFLYANKQFYWVTTRSSSSPKSLCGFFSSHFAFPERVIIFQSPLLLSFIVKILAMCWFSLLHFFRLKKSRLLWAMKVDVQKGAPALSFGSTKFGYRKYRTYHHYFFDQISPPPIANPHIAPSLSLLVLWGKFFTSFITRDGGSSYKARS